VIRVDGFLTLFIINVIDPLSYILFNMIINDDPSNKQLLKESTPPFISQSANIGGYGNSGKFVLGNVMYIYAPINNIFSGSNFIV
jgi:hypothetical protein